MSRVSYTEEFFDRKYSAREAYSRVWKYARPYRWRLLFGVLCGFLTAGTLVPVFQMVQPAVGGIELVGRSSKAEDVVSVDETKEIRDNAEGESYDRAQSGCSQGAVRAQSGHSWAQ